MKRSISLTVKKKKNIRRFKNGNNPIEYGPRNRRFSFREKKRKRKKKEKMVKEGIVEPRDAHEGRDEI